MQGCPQFRVFSIEGFPKMISIVQSFHEDMLVEFKVYGEGEIKVTNGLRRGCTMTPTLFNLYFNLVIETWCSQCEDDGVSILLNMNCQLISSRCCISMWHELKFADDTAITNPSREKSTHAMNNLFTVMSQWGLTISAPKPKLWQ